MSLLDEGVLWLLLKLRHTPDADHRPAIYYEVLLPFLARKPLQQAIAPTMKDAASEWSTPQRAGTCFYKCILATIRYYLRRHGFTQALVKRLTCDLRREYLHAVHAQLSAAAALRRHDVPLVRLACKQTAHAAMKLYKKSMCEEAYIKETAEQISTALGLLEALGSFVDSGPAALDMSHGNNSAVYARLPGFTAYMIGRDTRHLEGKAVAAPAQKRVDLLKLDKALTSKISSVASLLTSTKTAVHNLRRANLRSNIVTNHHIMAMVSRLFCTRIPYDNTDWLGRPGSLSRVTQRKMVQDTWILVKEYLGAWYCAADAADDAQTAARAITVAAAAAFVDTCVRTRPGDGRSYLTSALLRSPCHLHFADDINRPIGEVLAELATHDGDMLEARARLLEHVAAKRKHGRPIFNYRPASSEWLSFVLDTNSSTFNLVAAVTERLPSVNPRSVTATYTAANMPDCRRRGGWFVESGGAMANHCPEFVVYRDLAFVMRYMLRNPVEDDEDMFYDEVPESREAWHPADVECKWSVRYNSKNTKATVSVRFLGHDAAQWSEERVGSMASPARYLLNSFDTAYGPPPSNIEHTTEHDVAVAGGLVNFGDTLSQEEAERIVSFLTAPTLRIPLLVGYLTPDKASLLFNARLRKLLWAVLFQPLDFCPQAKLAAADAAIKRVPTPARWKLGTTHGALLRELQFAPGAVVRPLLALFTHMVALAVGHVQSATTTAVCETVRLSAAVHGAVQHCLAMPAGHSCRPTRGARRELEALDKQLGDLAQAQHGMLMRWAAQAEAAGEVHLAVNVHAHAALASSNVRVWTPKAVATFLASTAYVQLWHSFGVHVWPRGDGPSIGALFTLLDRHRSALVATMEDASYSAVVEVCQHVQQVATRNAAARWGGATLHEKLAELAKAGIPAQLGTDALRATGGDTQAAARRVLAGERLFGSQLDSERGCFVDPSGEFELLVQLGQLTAHTGPGLVAVPDKVARMPLFRRFVGRNPPQCLERARREQCVKLDLVGTRLQLTHWMALRGDSADAPPGGSGRTAFTAEFQGVAAKLEVELAHDADTAWALIYITNSAHRPMLFSPRFETVGRASFDAFAVTRARVEAGQRKRVWAVKLLWAEFSRCAVYMEYEQAVGAARHGAGGADVAPATAIAGWPLEGSVLRYMGRSYVHRISMGSLVGTARLGGDFDPLVMGIVRKVFRFELVTQAKPVMGIKKVAYPLQ